MSEERMILFALICSKQTFYLAMIFGQNQLIFVNLEQLKRSYYSKSKKFLFKKPQKYIA
jgi:hypothetical protein